MSDDESICTACEGSDETTSVHEEHLCEDCLCHAMSTGSIVECENCDVLWYESDMDAGGLCPQCSGNVVTNE